MYVQVQTTVRTVTCNWAEHNSSTGTTVLDVCHAHGVPTQSVQTSASTSILATDDKAVKERPAIPSPETKGIINYGTSIQNKNNVNGLNTRTYYQPN